MKISEYFFEGIETFKNKKLSKPRDLNLVGNDINYSSKDEKVALSPHTKYLNTYIYLFIVVAFMLLVIGRLFELQILKGDENKALSESNMIRVSNLIAKRGVIYDRNNKILAQNKPAFVLEMNSNICRFIIGDSINACYKELSDLSEYIELDIPKIKEQLEKGFSTVVISKGLNKEQILPIESNLDKFPSISVSVTPIREYPLGEAAAHLIGYTGFDENSKTLSIVGKYGIESYYNDIISGIDGKKVVQVDSSGSSSSTISEIASVPGRDIYLNIDYDVQKRAYEVLKEKATSDDMGANQIKGGAIIAQDPNTGGVIALVSYPSFDPNILSDGSISTEQLTQLNSNPDFPFFDRAISATYPPASTIKMAVAAAALAEGIITPETTIFDKGFIQIGNFIFRNWKLDGHGEVDLRRAIQVSNDTYFYTIGGGFGGIIGLGIERLSKWMMEFGYGNLTGIDLAAESPGFVPYLGYKDWYLGDTYISSIGQGDVLATPLQVNHVTNYFANLGYLVKPKILRSISENKVQGPDIIKRDIVSNEIHKIIRESMLLASQPGGTAYPLYDFSTRFDGVKVAGKTGTAEFGDPTLEQTHAWYTAFAPFENPNISVTVFLEGGGAGSSDAAPLARDVLEVWFSKNPYVASTKE